MKYTKQHSRYNPRGFIYGFLGKNFPVKDHFYENPASIKQLSEEIGFPTSSICFLNQTHSDKCFVVKDKKFALTLPEGDALATNKKDIILAIKTADCVPILFFDKIKNNIAIAHAGWKGVLNGVIQNTITTLLNLDSVSKNIEVVLGPCISQNSYEVDSEFYKKFVFISPAYQSFFLNSTTQEHFMFNLPSFVMRTLKECGIEKIFYLGQNTYNSKEWFSYREDTHKNNGKRSGHNISFIGII